MNYNTQKRKFPNDYDFIDYINKLPEDKLLRLYYSYKKELAQVRGYRETFQKGLFTQYEEDKELKRFIPFFEKAIRATPRTPSNSF